MCAAMSPALGERERLPAQRSRRGAAARARVGCLQHTAEVEPNRQASQFFMSYPVGSCMPCTASPLCGVGGTSLAYGVAEKDDESAECDAFGATAAAHATRLANATAGRPACYDALAVLYCAQEPVLSAASSCVEGAAGSSARTCSSSDYSSCSSHGREYTRGVHDCTLFCPAVAEACDGVASSLADCEAWCHALHVRASYCEVLRVSGVADALGVDWDVEVRDINNRYRLVKEVGTPVLIEGRPQYRSIPARRTGGVGRASTINYYMYATRHRGFSEWLLDTDNKKSNGAAAFVAAANVQPEHANSKWEVWNREQDAWIAVNLTLTCLDSDEELSDSAAPPAAAAGVPAAAALVLAAVLWRRGRR